MSTCLPPTLYMGRGWQRLEGGLSKVASPSLYSYGTSSCYCSNRTFTILRAGQSHSFRIRPVSESEQNVAKVIERLNHLNQTRHDQERDYIAENWRHLTPLTCAACRAERELPERCAVRTEATYGGGLRADLAFFDARGVLLGVIEVIDTHPPTEKAFAMQEKIPFVYYRLLNPRTSAKSRKFHDELNRGKFTYPEDDEGGPKWICSRGCLIFFDMTRGRKLIQ